MDTTVARFTAAPASAIDLVPPSPGGPSRALPFMSADAATLRVFVHHAGSIASDAPLEQVQREFGERQVDFLAIVRDGVVTGLCSRLRLGALLGARYGFALYSRSPAPLAQVEHPLVFPLGTPVREVLDRALARRGDEFNEDVVLVDERHALIGLVRVDALARLQSKLVSDQVSELQRQHQALVVAHQALRQSQGRYAGLFESAAMGVALLDENGNVQANNRRLSELFNVPAPDAELVSLLPWLVEADRAGFAALLGRHATGGPAPTPCEFMFSVPGRGQRLFRCSLGWIGETSQICACLDDITEQRAMERQLLRQEKQTLLDTLVGGIAHELNNKLTPVQGFSELIALRSDAQTGHYAELISRSVAEAAHIIRQLLQLSKPAASTAQRVDMRTIVSDALSMLRFQVRDARCTVKKVEPAAPVWVRADPAELKQVVINLALNALQAMADRTYAMLELTVEPVGEHAKLIVADNGIGIPAENLERIFDPFFTTKGPEHGTGLGLSVCFGIVRRHGGEIDVSSEPGAGATFTIVLPCDATEAAVIAEPAPRSTGIDLPRPAPGARALVVEDEPHVRRLIQTVLSSRFGCHVDTASHGVEAFELLAVHRYALVVSDVRMPTMNGTELYLWLREAQPLTARRFVFVTGYPGESHLERDIAQWNVPVLTKPFTVAQLCEQCAPFLDLPAEALVAASCA